MNRFVLMVFSAVFLFSNPCFSADTNTQFKTLQMAKPQQLKSFKPVTTVMIKQAPKLNLKLRPIKPETPVKPEGPNPTAAIDLADIIEDEALLTDLSVACGWDPHLIFQDKAAGNVFYYLPREFRLIHRQDTGYGLNVQYNHLKEEGAPSVMLTAELAAPHHPGDIALLKNILKKALGLKAGDKLILKSISGIGATADVQTMAAGLALDPERITLTLPSHLKKSFRLVLLLDQDETEEVLAQMTREGLTGNLLVMVADAQVPVPIHIQYLNFTGEALDGFTQWSEGRPTGFIKNTTAFPMELTDINGYTISGGNLKRISKKLKPVTLKPGQQKAFKLPPVSKLFGSQVMVSWMGSSMDARCTDCITKIDREVRKGVGAAAASQIKLEAIPAVFEDFDLYKIIIQVQSPYFSAEPGAVAIREAELTEGKNINQTIGIFPPQKKSGQPLLFRYRLKLITNDGTSVAQDVWQDAKSLSAFFGARQIEPMLEPEGEIQ